MAYPETTTGISCELYYSLTIQTDEVVPQIGYSEAPSQVFLPKRNLKLVIAILI